MTPELFSRYFVTMRDEVGKAFLGQPEVVELALYALFARGHILIEGVPGLGKTLLVRTLARVLGCEGKRIQFTPDLMPSDITGGNIFNQQENAFVFMPGPVFAQLLLADEINRSPAKTQAALLEAMQDRSVSIDGATRALPEPFFVMATQNPIESHGTYPLPEAQLDRFTVHVQVEHPGQEVELHMLRQFASGFDSGDLDTVGVRRVTDASILAAMRELLASLRVDDGVLGYITEIVQRTRSHGAVLHGASPRGSLALLATSRVRAASEGRDYVVPDDIKAVASACLRHRLVLNPDAEIEGVAPDHCLQEILSAVPVPQNLAQGGSGAATAPGTSATEAPN